MNLQGLPNYIRQHNINKGQDQQVVFTYPMIIDTTLQKYSNELRSFFSIIFLNQIKMSNILNITSSITNPSDNHIGRDFNPAEFLYHNLNPHQQIDNSNNLDSHYIDYVEMNNYQNYQNFILGKIDFIKHQLKTNPTYTKLKPYMTMISINQKYGLITIPMIVGTKQYPSNLNTMYWIMLAAIMMDLPLDSQDSIARIEKVLNVLNPVNYNTLLFSDESRHKLAVMSGINYNVKIDNPDINDKLKETYNIFKIAFGIVGSQLIVDPLTDFWKDFKQNSDIGKFIKTEVLDRIENIKHDIKAKIPHYDQIKNAIKRANEVLLVNRDPRSKYKFVNAVNLAQISSFIRDESKKELVFLNLCLDRARWDRYIGISTNNDSIFSVVDELNPRYRTIINDSYKLLTSFISTTVLGLIYHSIYVGESRAYTPTTIDYKITEYINNIIKETEPALEKIWLIIIDSMKSLIADKSIVNIDNSYLEKLAELGTPTQLNDNIVNTLNELSNSSISSRNEILTSLYNLQDYLDKISALANNLESQQITEFSSLSSLFKPVKNATNTNVSNQLTLNTEFQNYKMRVSNLTTNLIDSLITSNIVTTDTHPLLVRLFSANNYNNQHKREEFVLEMKKTMDALITSSILFLFLYTIKSYLNNIIVETKVKLETVKRDTTEFPNYCIVLPAYLINGLISAKIADTVKQLILTSESNFNPLRLKEVNAGDIKKIIKLFSDLLKIPNIMVVDDKTNTLYYKFMFMENVEKISMASLNSYISSQPEISEV